MNYKFVLAVLATVIVASVSACNKVEPKSDKTNMVPPIIYIAGDGSGNYNCDGTSDQVQINAALDYVAEHHEYTTVHLKGGHTFWIDEPIFISANTI